MFERFTERARAVVVLSQEEARFLGHNYIGTEHILLGLLREEDGIAARALASLGIGTEAVRAQVKRIVASSEEVLPQQIPFTPRAKRVLELSLREALALGHNHIGPEHVLLGLVRENDGVGARILLDFDAGAEKVRAKVLELLGGEPPPRDDPAAGIGRPLSAVLGLPIEVGASDELPPLLLAAAARALSAKRTEIEPIDLLHALTHERSVSALLAELGLEPERLRQAIEDRARGS